MDFTHPLPALRRALVFLCTLVLAGAAAAQDDPPGRVGRVLSAQGLVTYFDHDSGRWLEIEPNRPLTAGDRLATGSDGRAELRIGSTTLRLAEGSELELRQLDDERMSFELHGGTLALRVRSREVAREIDVLTSEVRLLPLRAGHYRIDRSDDTTYAGGWRGELRLDDRAGTTVAAGQRLELYRDAGGLRLAWGNMPDDDIGAWVLAADRADDQRSASQRYVSPEMTGAEDLDRYGQWDRHAEYGPIWYPSGVAPGWAPYRYGRWTWVRPWGWTWVDDARWGFAPFHYGRWFWWGNRWAWAPGAYVARPVYAPALVAWVGGANWGVSVNIGGPSVGWVPLAPREVYVPWYRHTPVYVERVNVHPPHRPGRAPEPRPQVPTGPVMYGNAGVPGAVTVVPRDVLVARQPVGRAVLPVPEAVRRAPVMVQPAPAAPPGHSQTRPGRAPGHSESRSQGRPRGESQGHAPSQASVPSQVQMVPGGALPVPTPIPAPAVAPRPVNPVPTPAVVPAAPTTPGGARVLPLPPPRPAQPQVQPQAQPQMQPQAQPQAQPQMLPQAQPRSHPQAPPQVQPQPQPQSPVPSPAPVRTVPPHSPAPPQVVAPPPAAPVVVPPPALQRQRPPEDERKRGADDERKRTPDPRAPSRDKEATR